MRCFFAAFTGPTLTHTAAAFTDIPDDADNGEESCWNTRPLSSYVPGPATEVLSST